MHTCVGARQAVSCIFFGNIISYILLRKSWFVVLFKVYFKDEYYHSIILFHSQIFMVIIIYERFFLVHFTFVFAYCTLYYLNLFTRFEIRINIINELKPEHTSNIYNYRYKSLRLVWNKKKKKRKLSANQQHSLIKKCANDQHCVSMIHLFYTLFDRTAVFNVIWNGWKKDEKVFRGENYVFKIYWYLNN